MKKLLEGLAFGAMMLGMAGMANATLVGDSITIQHFFPDLSTPHATYTAIVLDGESDTTSVMDYYDVNVDDSTIYVKYRFTDSGTYWTEADFNGLVVSSLNDSSGHALAGVLVNTNMPGWDNSRLSFSSDSVTFNWQGLYAFDTSRYFNASLDFGGQQPVPEPATMLLMGTGLAGLAATRRRKKTC
jgi:hypothetical protein